jgi:hypothetical protein
VSKKLKISLLVVGLMLVIGYVFWKDIAATALTIPAHQLANERPYLEETPQAAPLSQETFPITSYLTLGTVRIPIIFPVETSSSSETYAVARANEGDGSYFLVFKGHGFADAFRTEPESQTVCGVLSGTGQDVCDSNYAFLKTTLETTTDDFSLWTKREEKVPNSILYTLKSLYVRPGTIEVFKTDTLQGFRYVEEGEDLAATIFVDDMPYDIVTNITREEFDFILQHINY